MAYVLLHWIGGPAPGDARDAYERRARFDGSQSLIAALSQEMERQGMLAAEPGRVSVDEWDARLATPGQLVTRGELAAIMATATNAPAPLNPPLMSDSEWRAQWHEWLDFLVGALNYGGFRVERIADP